MGMKKSKKEKKSWWIGNGAAVLAVLVMVSCSIKPDSPQNLIENEQETRGLVNLFGQGQLLIGRLLLPKKS